MYRAFCCKPLSYEGKLRKYYYSDYSKSISNYFENFTFDQNGAINVETLIADSFPRIDADIFLSHSHNDIAEAEVFAKFMYDEFGLKCFLDAWVWDDYRKILERINQKFLHSDNNLNINVSTNASSNLCVILFRALLQMIHSTECFIFLRSKNALLKKDEIKTFGQNVSLSKWLYLETGILEFIKVTSPLKREGYRSRTHRAFMENGPIFEYELNLDSLCDITKERLEAWRRSFILNNHLGNPKQHPLDCLYDLQSRWELDNH